MLTYVLGLDFYSFNNREILQEKSSESGKKIKNQFVLFTLVYLIILPLLYVFGLFDFIGQKYILLFYLILIFDHIYRTFRLLVSFKTYTSKHEPIFEDWYLDSSFNFCLA